MTTNTTSSAHRLLALIPVDEPSSDPFASVRSAAVIGQAKGIAVEALLLGANPTEEQAREAALAGATRIWLAAHAGLSSSSTVEQFAAGFAEALSSGSLTPETRPLLAIAAANPVGEELAARLAVFFNGAALGRCSEISLQADSFVAQRSAFGARASMTVTGNAKTSGFAALRAPVAATEAGIAAPEIIRLTLSGALPPSYPTRCIDTPGKAINIEAARIIVSGGRGMRGPDGFQLLSDLAQLLDGAVAGSLPAVDAGWVPVAQQVGQSGKFVRPAVYVAVGISGTPQHMAGLGLETRILAINSDPAADIFRVAEIGAVGDWNEIIPALISELRAS